MSRPPRKRPGPGRPAAARGTPRVPAPPARAWLELAGCLLAALLLYAGSLNHPWISDDKEIVADNLSLASARPAVLARALASPYWSEVLPDGRVVATGDDRNLYRPATIASFWLNARLTGITPAGFRFVNILLLGLTAFLLGRVVAGLHGRTAGVVAMAITVAHPLGVDVVNRIIGRNELLVMVGLCGFVLVQQSARRAGWSAPRLVLAALSALVALGAKESGLVLPVLAGLVALLPPGPDAAAPAAADGAARPAPAWQAPALALAATALFLAARFAVVGAPHYVANCRSELVANPLLGLDMTRRLPAVGALAFYYARLPLVPYPLLALDHPRTLPGWGSPEAWAGALLLAAIVAAFGIALRRRSPVLLAAGWWLAGFLLVGQLVAPIGAYRDVRLAYPFLGALALGAGALLARWRRRPALACGLGAALALAALSVMRAGDYASERRLFEADLALRPENPSVLAIVGTLDLAEGRTAAAIARVEKAATLAPRSSEVQADLAAAYLSAERLTDAEAHLDRSLEFCDGNNVAWMTLGVLRLRQQRPADARTALLRAETIDAGHLPTQLNLCLVEEQLNLWDSARRRLDEIRRRAPGHPAIPVLAGPLQGR